MGVRVDVWWAKLIERYPNLNKVALAMLSLFHGPRVESLFSMVGNVLDKKDRKDELGYILGYPDSQINTALPTTKQVQMAVNQLLRLKEMIFTLLQ